MSRRSSRRKATSNNESSSIQPSIRRGLESICIGNESYVTKILSLDKAAAAASSNNDESSDNQKIITNALEGCMKMNNLSAEMLLARFFDDSVLSQYSIKVLNKSGKGSAATLAARIAKEWSKNDFHSTKNVVSDNKRKREEEEKEASQKKATKETDNNDDDINDWRAPLFFWKGALEKNANNQLTWKGSWVSGLAKLGLPDEKEFQNNEPDAAFELSCILNDGDENKLTNNRGEVESYESLGGYLQGHYFLDQGDGQGPQKFSDLAHYFQIHSRRSSGNKLFITAAGNTEFGQFVSAGYIEEGSTESRPMELILARRYIDENDSRYDKTISRKANNTKTRKCIIDFSLIPRLEKLQNLDLSQKSFWTTALPRKA